MSSDEFEGLGQEVEGGSSGNNKLKLDQVVVTLNALLKTTLLLFIIEGRVPETLKAPQ